MSKHIAIKGHPTRGKEVIQTLEMLGGKNVYNLSGIGYTSLHASYAWGYYVLRNSEICYSAYIYDNEPYVIFTLEEFLDKYPYKIGDKVEYIKYDDKTPTICVIDKMCWTGTTIEYSLDTNGITYSLTCLTKDIIPYKKKTLQEQIDNSFKQLNQNISQMSECACNISTEIIKKEIVEKQEILIGLVPVKQGKELIPHKDYDIKQIDNKFYLVKKKPTYPKTYDECCKILGCKANHFYTDFSCDGLDVEISEYEDKVNDLLKIFRKLIYCRDAYWKIAGEQMGLDKSWEPDWSTEYEIKYVIEVYRNNVIKNTQCYSNTILAFPTEEMLDIFYENFKELIETCKQYLS